MSRIQPRADLRRLEEELDELGDTHRKVILLRSFEERSFREISSLLGTSPDACRMLFARLRAAQAIKM